MVLKGLAVIQQSLDWVERVDQPEMLRWAGCCDRQARRGFAARRPVHCFGDAVAGMPSCGIHPTHRYALRRAVVKQLFSDRARQPAGAGDVMGNECDEEVLDQLQLQPLPRAVLATGVVSSCWQACLVLPARHGQAQECFMMLTTLPLLPLQRGYTLAHVACSTDDVDLVSKLLRLATGRCRKELLMARHPQVRLLIPVSLLAALGANPHAASVRSCWLLISLVIHMCLAERPDPFPPGLPLQLHACALGAGSADGGVGPAGVC